ncbi:Lcl C-terminal domain-containing protein [Geovibrio ferrireducens]|uniref:Lcl C-terminal domain-containing protein n=1 Tax=Geovibrio ferrireducens TaxID=46201 RepID=UPI002245DC0C|nr:DUF1566 domain-containing protein [Geovibrio ferrireducens]
MRKLIVLVMLISGLLMGCDSRIFEGRSGKGEPDAENPYKGFYTGVYSSPSVSGAWSITVDGDGDITGIAEDAYNSYESFSLIGSVNEDGSAVVIGNSFVSKLRAAGIISFTFDDLGADSITGTWSKDGGTSTGSFSGVLLYQGTPPVNTSPQISGTPIIEITAGNLYDFTPISFDADDDTVTFTILNKPLWADFNSETGALTGTPASGDVGVYDEIVITAVDGRGGYDHLDMFSITVNAANSAPEISGTPQTAITAFSAYSFTPGANDTDNDPLTFSITNKPDWATFSTSTGALTGTPDNSDAAVYSGIVISVSDGNGGSASLPAFSITVAYLNSAPTIDGTPNGSTVFGQAYSFIPNAADADNDPLTFSITNKPDWATFNTSTGALTGTPTLGNAGGYDNITISVSDGTADSVELAEFGIKVLGGVVKTGSTGSFGFDDAYYENIGYGITRNFSDDLIFGYIVDNNYGLRWLNELNNNTYTHADAVSYCATKTVGGFTWRLPSIKELHTIVNYNNSPAVESNFMNVTPHSYWSSTSIDADSNNFLYVNFLRGETYENSSDQLWKAVCVSGGSVPGSDFVKSEDGAVITDTVTQLVWENRTVSNIVVSWDIALSYCENLDHGGYTDWRLPNINELQTLYDHTQHSPSANDVFDTFDAQAEYYSGAPFGYYYWSSTSVPGDSSAALFGGFTNGVTEYELKMLLYNTICVRGGYKVSVP